MDGIRINRAVAAAAALALVAGGARAEVSGVSPSGFVVTQHAEVAAAPAQVFAAIGHPERWWNGEHTYSGDAANLSLALSAGGCFCERWGDNSVEHARVLYVGRDRALRLSGGFGPLQALAVDAILTMTLTAHDGRTSVQWVYRVSGNADAALDKLAGPVDHVLGDQLTRLAKAAAASAP